MSLPGAFSALREPAWTRTQNVSDLFDGQLLESRQGAGEEAHDEGGWGADNVQHGGWQHGDVGVLPGERVEQRHHRMAALGERAFGRTGGLELRKKLDIRI